MRKKLPDFSDMEANYPTGHDPEQVKADIGGSVDQAHYKNTCIIRVSKALNYAKHPIPPDSGWFRTKRGADKKWYGLRVREFWTYMEKTYGKPTVFEKRDSSGRIPPWRFVGKSGIIGFRVKGWNDASGHFTLWNGFNLLYGGEDHDYWGISYEAGLWTSGGDSWMTMFLPD
ncbi:MAG: type VI secretion system amidase effector protein Tae4 [Pyrinomonadaceae bacterium]|nr:type VI secretion system amidase effector protein Tae4 [Pyrinomonadaceae bacterium]